MTRLFTYTIPVDDGAAPNPFRGMCSLAICKPGIRRVAAPGDWVAGLGSKNAPSGDLSGRLVYAMRVDEVISLADYDRSAPSRWPHRIPNVNSADLSDRLGDCIYDYSNGVPVQRRGVHGPANQETDLSGKNVLISRHFYYFGSRGPTTAGSADRDLSSDSRAPKQLQQTALRRVYRVASRSAANSRSTVRLARFHGGLEDDPPMWRLRDPRPRWSA